MKKFVGYIIILVLFFVGVYEFMVFSRPFDLGIEIPQKMHTIAKNNGLKLTSSAINPKEVYRPLVKEIRTEAHKFFSKLDLMIYEYEQSDQYTFTNDKGDTMMVCKTLLVGDHLRILEVQSNSSNEAYRKEFEVHFIKKHIFWRVEK